MVPPVPDIDPLVGEFLAIVERHRLTDAEAAALSGLAAHTMKLVRVTRTPPKREQSVRKICSFVERNRGARERGDLHFCA